MTKRTKEIKGTNKCSFLFSNRQSAWTTKRAVILSLPQRIADGAWQRFCCAPFSVLAPERYWAAHIFLCPEIFQQSWFCMSLSLYKHGKEPEKERMLPKWAMLMDFPLCPFSFQHQSKSITWEQPVQGENERIKRYKNASVTQTAFICRKIASWNGWYFVEPCFPSLFVKRKKKAKT